MNKKILFITNGFGMGGAEKVLIDIVRTLVEAHFVVEVLTFTNSGALKEEMEKTCDVFTLFNSKLHFLVFRKLRPYRRYRINKFVSTQRYDFVVGFMEGKPTTLLADINIKIRKIAWIHNDFTKLNIGLLKSEMHNMYETVNRIVCVSHDAQQAFFKSIPELNVNSQVIYNLIDEANVKALSEAKEIKNDVFTFLNVGMLRKQKSQYRLVHIAERLKKEGYDFQIHIIGDGPLRSYLENLIDQLHVRDKITLLGLKENPYPYIKACDCFVLASDFEGYGIVIKEALFLKKLVLTTDVVGPGEILEDGKYGLIVDISEDALFKKMQEILDGKYDYNVIRTNVEQYRGDNDKIKRQLCELFA